MCRSGCRLRAGDGVGGVICDAEGCTLWSSHDRLSLFETKSECAIRYFQLLGGDEDLAEWMLSVKDRLDGGAIGSSPA